MGNRRLFKREGIDPASAEDVMARLEGEGKTVMLVARDGRLAGAMSYGQYFPMAAQGPYRIDVRIVRPGSGTPVETTFTYSRPR